jgi:predicted proteasome-type protease
MTIDFSKYGTPVSTTSSTGATSAVTPTNDFSKYGTPISEQQTVQTVSEPNYFQRVAEQYKKGGEDIVSGITKSAEQISTGQAQGNVQGLGNVLGGIARAGIRTVGGVAEAAFAPITEIPIVKKVLEFGAEKIAGIPAITNLITKGSELATKYPEYAKDIQNIVDIATLGVGGAVEKPLLTEGKLVASDVIQASKALLNPSEEAIQNRVIELFNKSIKPTVKKTATQAEKYENDTLKALRTIKDNADNLKIEDATGELISGRTPQTINELSQGLEQTKKIVFEQYDSLAKKAGTKGAVIDAKPIADEVLKVTQNKALQITNPEIITYAKSWEARLRNLDTLDTETTQAVIQNMNTNLQAFYKSPTYESASKVAIDAGIANNFRKALDKAIEGATGEQYQALKNQYAALKAIENDVVKATMRDAKKNVKGLLDYTDIFTGGQMLSGILSLNPAQFTKGAIERGLKEYIKFLNDPNRAIANIFEQLGKTPAEEFIPKSATLNLVRSIKK